MFITTDMYRILCLCFLYTLILTGCQKETVIYTVSFDTRGGKLIQEMAVEEGTAYDPPTPEREGYTFTGWYSSPDLNRPWKEDDIITDNTTLYASWQIQTRKLDIIFNNEEQDIAERELTYGSYYAMDFVPFREGYVFTGWYKDDDCTVPYDDSVPITEDTSVYAGWRKLVHIELELYQYINQNDYGAPKGCEGAALLMALQMTGNAREYGYSAFMQTMPYSPDASPYKGFAGSPWKDTEYIDAIMPGITAEWGSQFGEEDITGCSVNDLIECLENGHPIIVWTSIHFLPSQLTYYEWGIYKSNNHVMVLIGYDEKTDQFKIADPAGWNDGIYWVTGQQFDKSWGCYKGAVRIS